jgi:ABC-type transport system involved in multi-copper enzyme maturation permease subunit
LLVGPVFTRELVTSPRRPRLFAYRAVYATVLFGVMCTAWLILTGTQVISNVGDMARFGGILFQLLAPLQLAVVIFFAALSTASAVAQEKDRKTLVLLLLTRLNNHELVLGKLLASLLHVAVMVLAGLPVFAAVVLFGGVSFAQVARVFVVTLATGLVAGSLGSTIALWREKTFQALALTALLLVFWMLGCEAIGSGVVGQTLGGDDVERWAIWLSPARAIQAAARPSEDLDADSWYQGDVLRFVWFSLAAVVLLNGVAIACVRRWNPSREVKPQAGTLTRSQESIWGAEHDEARGAARATSAAPASREQRPPPPPHRVVWTNPILWREIRTWAYGRKMIVVRLVYVVLFAMAFAGVVFGDRLAATQPPSVGPTQTLPPFAWPTIPFFVVSLAIINALAVTSITTERDGRALDLLLVTDLSPKEFLFGKLGGVLWVSKEMVLLPIALCIYLWRIEVLSLQDWCYVVGGLLVLDVFVAVLGIHSGMNYANSRAAIGVSLGTVFFLFLGIATCIVMMISFSGAFQIQLAPFLAFILGGGVGLYVALGARNPSPAILLASLVLPFATFYAITSFLMDYTLAVFLVMATAYCFTTAAMLIPALAEFDFAMGRNATDEE